MSSISLHHGGLANAFFRSAMGGMLGAEMNLQDIPGTADSETALLFSESQGRILVSINPQNKKVFEEMMKGVSFKNIGKVLSTNELLVKSKKKKKLFKNSVEVIEQSYKRRFKAY